MLQAPTPSPYDVQFRIAGWNIRVSWTFWLGATLFGFGLVRSLQDLLGAESPHLVVLLTLWILAMFTSILIHELGHAFMFRRYGVHSHIVLYHFGGLAIPTSGSSYSRVGTSLRPMQDFWVSAAGPLVQLGSAIALLLLMKLTGKTPEGIGMLPSSIVNWLQADTSQLASPALRALAISYLLPSIFWAVLNIIPVYPLDGGQMCRAIVEANGKDDSIWIWISVATGGCAAIYCLKYDLTFLTILFAMLAVQSYRMLPHVR